MSYFKTSIPGSGIFLPVHRAEKRSSPALSFGDDLPGSPDSPSYAAKSRNNHGIGDYAPPTPSLPKFSQSVGPGMLPSSPHFKPQARPSLPRPESPFRKQPALGSTPSRNFSMSQRGGPAPPRFAASPQPIRSATPKAATPRSVSTSRTPAQARPYSRSGSRLGHRSDTIPEKTVVQSSYPNPHRSPSRQMRPNPDQEQEIQQLWAQLEEKDKQLKDQADALVEMEVSLKEIQALIPSDGESANGGMSAEDSADVAQLRRALREKNERIQTLVAEFDGHRADFRSTIDTLELASSETERVYEAKVSELLAEVEELRELSHSQEDVRHVAEQLKSLEELVAELEEGLEDARRGEAEARGEVEFLRGEVERGRSELRREREKAAKALQGAKEAEDYNAKDRDVEMKDDEIRGLKAIIHSLSSGPEVASPVSRGPNHAASNSADLEELTRTQASVQQLEREKSELQGLVERKAFREEELERAIEQLRKAAQQERNSILQEQQPSPESTRRSSSIKPLLKTLRSPPLAGSSVARREERKWCDVCETDDHDLLTCDSVFTEGKNFGREYTHGSLDGEEKSGAAASVDEDAAHENGHLHAPEVPASDASHQEHEDDDDNPASTANGATAGAAADDSDKWCALCEKDGHLAFDCPDEQY